MSLENAINMLNSNIETLVTMLQQNSTALTPPAPKADKPPKATKPKADKPAKSKEGTKAEIAINVDQVRAALVKLKQAGGEPTEILKEMGVEKLSELLPAQYAKAIKAANLARELLS